MDLLDIAVATRDALIARARSVIGQDYSGKGLSSRQIKLDALTAAGVNVTDRSDDYVDGRFDALVPPAPRNFDSRSDDYVNARFDAVAPPAPPVAPAPPKEWERPLSASREKIDGRTGGEGIATRTPRPWEEPLSGTKGGEGR